MHLHLRPRFSTCVLVSLLLTLIGASVLTGQQRDSLQRTEIGLEILLPSETTPRIRLAGPYGGGGRSLILRQLLRVNDPIAAGDFTALNVDAQSDGEAMKVALSIIYNDLSDHEWWKDKKEKSVGTYAIKPGESIRPAELAEFGIEPFEMRVISAKPAVLKPGEGPRIVNKTTVLEVWYLEKHLDHYLISLKNVSGKNVIAYTIWTGHTGSGSQGRVGAPVLAAGATGQETHLQASDVDREGITISDVIFEDGTFEGDPKRAAEFLARQEGIRIQSPPVLRRVEQALKVDDSDLRAEFDKLEADLWVIPEAIDKASALEYLKTKFPAADDKTRAELYEHLKGGLYDARNIALMTIGETRRGVEAREEQGQFATAVESIRRSLTYVKQNIEKIISAPR